MVGAKQFFRSFDGDIFNDIHALAAAVVALGRETFCVLVGQDGSHCHHNGFGNDIFRSNQLDVAFLAGIFRFDCFAHFRVALCDEVHNVFNHSKKPP